MPYHMHKYKFSFLLHLSSQRQPRRPEQLSSSFRHYGIEIQVSNCCLQPLPTDMSLLAISTETKDKTLAKFDLDEQITEEAAKILKEWLETQPHLPHDYGKYLLTNLLTCLLTYSLHGAESFLRS